MKRKEGVGRGDDEGRGGVERGGKEKRGKERQGHEERSDKQNSRLHSWQPAMNPH